MRIETAFDADRYLGIMKGVAETVLRNSDIFETDLEKQQIPLLVESITGESTGTKMEFVMRAVSVSNLFPGEFDAQGNPIWDSQSQSSPPKDVVEWVAQFKEKEKERDAFRSGAKKGEWYSDEKIAARVLQAIQRDPTPWMRTDQPGHGALNPTGLARIVGLTGLAPEKVSRALLLVLMEWKKGMQEIIPHAIRLRIQAAFQ